MRVGEILVSEDDIARMIARLVEDIIQDYGDEELVFVGIMDGALCLLADMARAFPRSVEVMTARATSYEGTESRGELVINWLPTRERIQGKHVLLIEDIVDTGFTLSILKSEIESLGAASVNVCALLNKPSRREHDVDVAYVGFEVPDVFVVGYGLDYDGDLRNLRDVHEMESAE